MSEANGPSELSFGLVMAAAAAGQQAKRETSWPNELSGFTSRGAQPAKPNHSIPINQPISRRLIDGGMNWG